MKRIEPSRLLSQPWFYATAGAFLVWLVILTHSAGAGGGAVISAALNYSVFFAVVGLGQMIVMASGAGNIDLSIPANITLAAYLSTGQMEGGDAGLVTGIAAGLASGVAIGLANAFLIIAFRIPPDYPTPNFPPSWNVAPTDNLPVVRHDAKAQHRTLDLMRWGLVPFWAKDIKIGFSTINAMAETVETKPVFREAFQRRRSSVPVDSFYEWKKLATNGRSWMRKTSSPTRLRSRIGR
jgi:hypothetical protein